MAKPAAPKGGKPALDSGDVTLFPHGNANYRDSGGMRVFAFQQLGELDVDLRGEALALAQMSGWLPNVEPDADLIKLIPL
jgi:hypothetical protein